MDDVLWSIGFVAYSALSGTIATVAMEMHDVEMCHRLKNHLRAYLNDRNYFHSISSSVYIGIIHASSCLL